MSRDAAIRRAAVRRVRRGIYCLDPDRKPDFTEAVVAALLVLPRGSVAAGATAARLWRYDVPTEGGEPLEFLVPGPRNCAKLRDAVLRFDAFTGVDLPDGVPSTSQARTLVDLAARLDFGDGVVVVESALRSDPSLSSLLVEEQRRRTPRRGAERVIRTLTFAGPLSESVLESRTRVVWYEAGLPAPVQQAVIRHGGRFVARVDFLWEQARLVVEVDGLAKYGERGALRDEKRRQNELVALGYTVLRFTWSDIVGRPDHVVAQVASMIKWK